MAFSVTLPAASVEELRTYLASRQSPSGSSRLMIGINRSSLTAVTTPPTAAPMITPTASASALVFVRNPRNSAAVLLIMMVNHVTTTPDAFEVEGRDHASTVRNERSTRCQRARSKYQINAM